MAGPGLGLPGQRDHPPLTVPTGYNPVQLSLRPEQADWGKAIPGRFMGSWSYYQFYAPLAYVQASTLSNVLDPSFLASMTAPFHVQAQIRDRSGAVGTMVFDGDLATTWRGSEQVRDANASGDIGSSPAYRRNLTLGDTTYDVNLMFNWGPWFAPGWDDRPGESPLPDGRSEWVGGVGFFSLGVQETHNTPEPGTLALAGLGFGALAVRRVRRFARR